MKKFIIALILLLLITNSYSKNTSIDNSCIPFLINNIKGQKTYIKDSCVEDTLKISITVDVRFDKNLFDTIFPIKVKSVKLINCVIPNPDNPDVNIWLFNNSKIENPFYQYIWDLMSAKASYWYIYQPYNELPMGDRKNTGNVIRMAASFWLIPEE